MIQLLPDARGVHVTLPQVRAELWMKTNSVNRPVCCSLVGFGFSRILKRVPETQNSLISGLCLLPGIQNETLFWELDLLSSGKRVEADILFVPLEGASRKPRLLL
jgi:hypothetical protein